MILDRDTPRALEEGAFTIRRKRCPCVPKRTSACSGNSEISERFIQTSLREWAYARAYPTSEHRKQALDPWLHNYNWHRPHGSLQSKPPISRLNQPMNNLLRLHI